MNKYKISLIGSGNVATHLGNALFQAGHNIVSIYSRNLESASILASQLNNPVILKAPDFTAFTCDIIIMCIKDDSIADVAKNITCPPATIICHTSGSADISVLRNYTEQCGVFYPVQSFTKDRALEFKSIPIVIEAPTHNAEIVLTEIALSISSKIYYLNSERRKTLHLAAVFSSNFSNYLISVAQRLLEKENIDYKILQSLMEETIGKAFSMDPKKAQTGPASRNDQLILELHKEMLKNDPELLEIYEKISRAIAVNKNKS